MSLYQNSGDDLSSLISAAAGGTVATADYTILAIRATTSAEKSGAANGKNTKIAIQMNASSTYRGQISLYYDRLDLGALSNFTPFKLSMQPGVDITQTLTTIRDMYGILFTMNDLQSGVQTVDDGSGTGASQITLTALSTSPGYTGTVVIHFAPLPDISTAFFSNQLPGF